MALAQISPVILSAETATKIVAAGIAKATELGIPFTFSVLDGGGNLVQLHRMDGAALASIETSMAKARTSVYFATPTADLAGAVTSGGPLATIETSTSQPLAFVAGGVPVTNDQGVVIGALGAGGASPEQDHKIAKAAVASIDD